MSAVKNTRKSKKLSTSKAALAWHSAGYICISVRYADEEHRQLVKDAAKASKMSLNAWIVQATLNAARQQLREASGS